MQKISIETELVVSEQVWDDKIVNIDCESKARRTTESDSSNLQTGINLSAGIKSVIPNGMLLTALRSTSNISDVKKNDKIYKETKQTRKRKSQTTNTNIPVSRFHENMIRKRLLAPKIEDLEYILNEVKEEECIDIDWEAYNQKIIEEEGEHSIDWGAVFKEFEI